MVTIKLVVIGGSGVGKTSVRSQYISGRFMASYKATIGADFITKTLPHPTKPEEPDVLLTIWDTAGQERFSSLSSAFFRGADAVILMFDVNMPETLEVLTKWWAEFKERAPLADEDMDDFCCVVVGNKVDLLGQESPHSSPDPVTKDEARAFLRVLVPPMSRSSSPVVARSPDADGSEDEDAHDELTISQHTIRPSSSQLHIDLSTPPESPSDPSASQSGRPPIPIMQPNGTAKGSVRGMSLSPKQRSSKSHSRSSSRYYSGTMTSTHTTQTIYHTPSSSLFDTFQSARSSPEPWHSSNPSADEDNSSLRARRMTNGSASSGSAITMTPSLFARERDSLGPHGAQTDANHTQHGEVTTNGLLKGPKLFFTSAKTGEGVSDVFEYIARRVVGRWEYEEQLEARQLHIREASATETIRLGLQSSQRKKEGGILSGCC